MERAIKESTDKTIRWKENIEAEMSLLLAAWRSLSSRYHVKLSADSVVFYFFSYYAAQIRWSSEKTWNNVRKEFVHIFQFASHLISEAPKKISSKTRNKIGRPHSALPVSPLKALHKSIEISLIEHSERAVISLDSKTLHFHAVFLHIMLMSYVTDLNKCMDLVSLKLGTGSASPCPHCHISQCNLSTNTKK